eukprot:SAG31_NODE_34591_length_331_cov_1.025862_1_plen_33_part_10
MMAHIQRRQQGVHALHAWSLGPIRMAIGSMYMY